MAVGARNWSDACAERDCTACATMARSGVFESAAPERRVGGTRARWRRNESMVISIRDVRRSRTAAARRRADRCHHPRRHTLQYPIPRSGPHRSRRCSGAASECRLTGIFQMPLIRLKRVRHIGSGTAAGLDTGVLNAFEVVQGEAGFTRGLPLPVFSKLGNNIIGPVGIQEARPCRALHPTQGAIDRDLNYPATPPERYRTALRSVDAPD